MRQTALLVLFVLGVSSTSTAQVAAPKGASLEAKNANDHYKRGWEAMRKEAWDAAVNEFQTAIESDQRFALAYYSLGRAQMGRHDFPKAIAAYTSCRDLYLHVGGEQFTNQLDAKRRIEDRMLEYQTAIQQAQQSSAGKPQQSQQLYVRQLQETLNTLQQAKDRSEVGPIDVSVPYFVPMALGAAYFRSGQFEAAEREYLTAIRDNPASGETHNNLAVLYLTTNRIPEAEAEVKAAEKAGYHVNENLKSDILQKRRGGSPAAENARPE